MAAILAVSGTTLRVYFDQYQSGRLEALKVLNYQGKSNELMAHKDELVAALEANPPGTLKEAQARIEATTGLKRSLPQVSAFLKKTNLSGAK